jgi:hypothetical protein
MVRKTSVDASTKWLSRTVWLAPMNVGGMDIHFDGLILVKSTDNFGTNVLAQPDLLIDVLPKGRLQAGVRVEYARYKTPGGGSYRRTTPFLMAKLVFWDMHLGGASGRTAEVQRTGMARVCCPRPARRAAWHASC